MNYWMVKLYSEGAWAGLFFVDEGEARKAFGTSSGGLGNPHLGYDADIMAGTTPIGRTGFNLKYIDKVELVRVTVLEEEVIDTIVNEPPEEE